MSKHSIIYIGLDTHKVSTEVAHIEDQRGAKRFIKEKLKQPKPPSRNLRGNINLNIPMQHCILFTKLALVAIGFTDC
jgi:hypothetical protein